MTDERMNRLKGSNWGTGDTGGDEEPKDGR